MAENFDFKLGQKLKQAREQIGLTQEEVSQEMGFDSQVTISSIESGQRKVKANELALFAKIYHRSVERFLDDKKKEEEKILVSWRSCSNNPDVKIKEQEFLKYCHNYYDLEIKLDLDHRNFLNPLSRTYHSPEDFDFKKVEELAQEYFYKMQLGSRPACPLRKILEERYNIKILYYDLGDCGSAASAISNFGAAILINSTEPLWLRNFNLAHELFHILTWNIFEYKAVHNSNDEKDYVERLADAFATSLLLPSAEITKEFKKKLVDNKISIIDVISIAREFEVSTEALLWRLVNLKLLKKDIVKEVLNSDDFHKIDKTERVKDHKRAPDISEKYVGLAFKAYSKGLLTKGKLAEYLDVNIADVSMKLATHGYNLEEVYSAELVAT